MDWKDEKSSRQWPRKMTKKFVPSAFLLTLIKTHQRAMQSDENKSTSHWRWPSCIHKSNGHEKWRPHYASAAESNSFLRSVSQVSHSQQINHAMWNVKCFTASSRECEKWMKEKTFPHSAATGRKIFYDMCEKFPFALFIFSYWHFHSFPMKWNEMEKARFERSRMCRE